MPAGRAPPGRGGGGVRGGPQHRPAVRCAPAGRRCRRGLWPRPGWPRETCWPPATTPRPALSVAQAMGASPLAGAALRVLASAVAQGAPGDADHGGPRRDVRPRGRAAGRGGRRAGAGPRADRLRRRSRTPPAAPTPPASCVTGPRASASGRSRPRRRDCPRGWRQPRLRCLGVNVLLLLALADAHAVAVRPTDSPGCPAPTEVGAALAARGSWRPGAVRPGAPAEGAGAGDRPRGRGARQHHADRRRGETEAGAQPARRSGSSGCRGGHRCAPGLHGAPRSRGSPRQGVCRAGRDRGVDRRALPVRSAGPPAATGPPRAPTAVPALGGGRGHGLPAGRRRVERVRGWSPTWAGSWPAATCCCRWRWPPAGNPTRSPRAAATGGRPASGASRSTWACGGRPARRQWNCRWAPGRGGDGHDPRGGPGRSGDRRRAPAARAGPVDGGGGAAAPGPPAVLPHWPAVWWPVSSNTTSLILTDRVKIR